MEECFIVLLSATTYSGTCLFFCGEWMMFLFFLFIFCENLDKTADVKHSYNFRRTAGYNGFPMSLLQKGYNLLGIDKALLANVI